jgi:hypothetical protein
VAGLLEIWEINVGFDIAPDPRIAIPVPGSAEISGVVNDPEVIHARLAELDCGGKSADACAHDDNVHLIGLNRPQSGFTAVRVVAKSGEIALDGDVLGKPLGPESLGAFFAILLLEPCSVALYLSDRRFSFRQRSSRDVLSTELRTEMLTTF